MNRALELILSMSVSGGLLILALLLGRRLLGKKVSRQWQYYIWLAVIARLLLPFGPEASLMGSVRQAAGEAVVQAAHTEAPPPAAAPEIPAGQDGLPLPSEGPAETAGEYLWLIWLGAALGLLVRKATAYQSFVRYVAAGSVPVSDTALLDRLALAAEEAGVRRPVELWEAPAVSSPLLLGFFRPRIVLPRADVPAEQFRYIVLHELTHWRRRDPLYKWLVQVAVCLHWFNPLVHLMGREVSRACEFSCDEAVLARVGPDAARNYGGTLLEAMAAVGRYRSAPGAVTLSENVELLKERLGAIMSFHKKSPAVRSLTGLLTVCIVLGAVFLGVYPASARRDEPRLAPPPVGEETKQDASREEEEAGEDKSVSQAERYYEAGSLPLFQIAFSRLDAGEQEAWLERLYEDGAIAFFSTLTDDMSEEALERWLDRALEDGDWAFQSMLFSALDREDEFDGWKEQWEKDWEESLRAEYGPVGVTMDGKDFYYQGKLVNVFLDARPDSSFYTLDVNPAGTVSIRILRGEDGQVTGVALMTDAEVEALFGDMEDDEDWDEEEDWDEDEDWDEGGRIYHPEVLPICLEAVEAGETVWLGEYTLSEGDRLWYSFLAGTGNRMKVFFARDGQEDPVYWSVNNLRQAGEALICSANFTVEPPAGPGTYQLYLQAPEDALKNVIGTVSIAKAP